MVFLNATAGQCALAKEFCPSARRRYLGITAQVMDQLPCPRGYDTGAGIKDFVQIDPHESIIGCKDIANPATAIALWVIPIPLMEQMGQGVYTLLKAPHDDG